MIWRDSALHWTSPNIGGKTFLLFLASQRGYNKSYHRQSRGRRRVTWFVIASRAKKGRWKRVYPVYSSMNYNFRRSFDKNTIDFFGTQTKSQAQSSDSPAARSTASKPYLHKKPLGPPTPLLSPSLQCIFLSSLLKPQESQHLLSHHDRPFISQHPPDQHSRSCQPLSSVFVYRKAELQENPR